MSDPVSEGIDFRCAVSLRDSKVVFLEAGVDGRGQLGHFLSLVHSRESPIELENIVVQVPKFRDSNKCSLY